jgi:glucose-1-phosphate thymidylyltransferase
MSSSRPTDKVVILARGLGTRMRKADDTATLDAHTAAIADTGVKAMIPIDRPFLDYVLHAVAEAGYTRACLVIGPEHQQVRDYFNKLNTRRLRIEFAVQEKPLGTANAVAPAESFSAGDDFLMINSDNYYPASACRELRLLSGPGIAAFEKDAMLEGSNIPADRIQKFAAAVVGADGNLQRVIEKPDDQTLKGLGPEIYLSMNCWRLGPSIFDACRAIKPSPRGEYEITDAVQYTIDHLNTKYRVVKSRAAVLDMSSRSDIGPVARRLAGSEVNL